MQTQVHKEHML